MMKFILLFVITCSAFATPREEAQELLERFKNSNPSIRMEQMSASLINLPYGIGGPLGEGEMGRYDQDPLYRFDTFDCTTFVETLLSLAISTDVDDFEKNMDSIRYEDSKIDYLSRNHFPSLQWIPNNINNGRLIEINHLILAPNQWKIAEAVINLPGWLKKIKLEEIKVPSASSEERQFLLEELRSYSSQYSPIVAQLKYLPLSTLLATPSVLKKIPHGSIINFVRPNWDLTNELGTHMNVSHQGLIFQTKQGPVLRHASLSDKKVTDILLLDYLKKFENHPTLKGIHLMQMNLH
jgi:hypothetical protein